MSKQLKISVIGAGSAQFSLGVVKDLCLTEGVAGSHVSFMDIDEERLEMIYKLAVRYASQVGSKLTFEKTTNRQSTLDGADFVINTGYVLGHIVEANLRDLCSKYGYYHFGGSPGPYHQYWLMLSVAKDIEKICPNAWLLQVGNPVFSGSTLMTRETSTKVIGLCHGHYGYREVASVLGLDPDKVVWEAPGLNHNIWLTRFEYEGKDAYPLLDEWIETKGEEYWRTHRAQTTHDAQMSCGAINEYKLYGLMPIGDTVRRGGWWYHTDIMTKKRWFGEPFGGPDTHVARPYFVKNLEKRIAEMIATSNDPKADLARYVGTTRTREQIVMIIDALVNNNEGTFQVNIPNKGSIIPGINENVVIETQAVINQQGIHPIKPRPIPEKILFNHILPEWLDMERDILAFKTGDKAILLWQLLDAHQTKSYDQAVYLLNELINDEGIKGVEEFEKFTPEERISNFFKYPKPL